MHHKATPHMMKTAVFLASLGLVAMVSACAPVPQPVANSQVQISGDPVLAFVSSGSVGQTGVVNDPAAEGNEVIVIETQYNAASGEICRTYAATSSNGQSQHLACSDGAAWHTVAPLVISSN